MRRRQVKFYHSGSVPFPFGTVNGSFGSHLGTSLVVFLGTPGGFCSTLYQPLRTEHLRVLEKHAAAEKDQGKGSNANHPYVILCQKHPPFLFFPSRLPSLCSSGGMNESRLFHSTTHRLFEFLPVRTVDGWPAVVSASLPHHQPHPPLLLLVFCIACQSLCLARPRLLHGFCGSLFVPSRLISSAFAIASWSRSFSFWPFGLLRIQSHVLTILIWGPSHFFHSGFQACIAASTWRLAAWSLVSQHLVDAGALIRAVPRTTTPFESFNSLPRSFSFLLLQSKAPLNSLFNFIGRLGFLFWYSVRVSLTDLCCF